MNAQRFWLASILLLLAPEAGASVVVHGITHDPLGSAVVSSTASPTGEECRVTEIGSSGDDGVQFDVANTNGISLRFGPPPFFPATPIDRAQLSLRQPVGGVTSVIGTSSMIVSGSDLVLNASALSSSEVVVDVYNGEDLVLSAKPTSSQFATFIDSGLSFLDDRTFLGLRTYDQTVNGVPHRFVWATFIAPSATTVTVDGHSVTGDRVDYTFTLTISLGTSDISSAQLRLRSGSPSPAAVALTGEVLIMDPDVKSGVPKPQAASLNGRDLVLQASSEPGMISYAPSSPGGGCELRVETVWNKTCVEKDTKIDLANLVFNPLDPSSLPPFSTQLVINAEYESFDGSVSQIVPETVETSWDGHQVHIGVHAGTSDHDFRTTVRNGGVVLVRSSSAADMTLSALPASMLAHSEDGILRIRCMLPPGTVVTIDGASMPATQIELVVVIAVLAGPEGSPLAWNRRISDIRIVHPPGTPPGTYRAIKVEVYATDQWGNSGGLAIGGHGPRQSVSLDGSYVHVDNLGVGDEDGVEIGLDGIPGARLVFPVPPVGLGVSPPHTVQIMAQDCVGNCSSGSSLECSELSETGVFAQLSVLCEAQGTHPLYVEVNGRMEELAITDLNGDGKVDLMPYGPSGKIELSSVSYLYVSEWTECWSIESRETLKVHFQTGDLPTQRVRVWRNPGGSHLGDPSPSAAVLRVRGMPPGIPVKGTLRGVTSLTFQPQVEVAGCGIGMANVNHQIAGEPVIETWATLSGPVSVSNSDALCGNEVRSSLPIAVGPDWTYSGTPAVFSRSPVPAQGHVVAIEATTETIVFRPARGEVKAGFVAGPAPNDLWDVVVTDDVTSSMEVHRRSDVSHLVWSPHSNKVLQTTFQGDGPFTFDALPSTLAILFDHDTNRPRMSCVGFPPGSHIFVNGSPVPCDSLVVEMVGAPTPTDMQECRVLLPNFPGLTQHFRMAAIPQPGYTTGVPAIPALAAFAVSPTAPNPFFARTTVQLSMSRAAEVRAAVYDLAGREVARLANGRLEAGTHTLSWDGRTRGGAAAPAGLYFVRVARDGAEERVARVTRLR